MARRRLRFLLNLVDHLPRDSHFVAALADDEELAENAPPAKPGPPAMHDWTAEVERLTLIADRLGELVTAVYNASPNAKKAQKPPRPLLRPETARDRVARRRRRMAQQRIDTALQAARTAGRPDMATGTADPTTTASRQKT